MADSDSEYEPEYEPEEVVVIDPDSSDTSDTSSSPPPLLLSVMTLVPPPLEYMSKLHDDHLEVSSRVVWAGSLLLVNNILRTPALLEQVASSNKKVLELGAGTGIVGLSLAKKNACKLICFTDGDEEALMLLKENASMNKVDISANAVSGVPPAYLWGDDDERISALEEWSRNHWSDGWGVDDKFGFDSILAGDVLYKEGLPELFFGSVNRLLTMNGVLMLCHVPRAEVTHERVEAAATAANLDFEEVPPLSLPKTAKMEDAVRAKIYRITKIKK
ncbi:hypothetical protein TrLO_g7656 [Triparma laevis f. longispina]|uniref:Uncharacterized protein n=1 Tax=Triparma laevis f. longispina TaxID=1714387 RepID=A0A9W7F7G8_9STRA|nr:hypothetical protein TrLO_g7656 [Triparma laevis f. longispina]